MKLQQQIESILFVSSRVLKKSKLLKVLNCKPEELEQALDDLQKEYKEHEAGIALLIDGDRVQMITAPETSEIVQKYLKDERSGELTRPSLETLAIIAYRGPIGKAEIELIRGVNCSLILRNLLIRGLIVGRTDPKSGVERYQVTFEFMQHLGVRELKDLPDFKKLNEDVNLQELLEGKKEEGDFFKQKNG